MEELSVCFVCGISRVSWLGSAHRTVFFLIFQTRQTSFRTLTVVRTFGTLGTFGLALLHKCSVLRSSVHSRARSPRVGYVSLCMPRAQHGSSLFPSRVNRVVPPLLYSCQHGIFLPSRGLLSPLNVACCETRDGCAIPVVGRLGRHIQLPRRTQGSEPVCQAHCRIDCRHLLSVARRSVTCSASSRPHP